MDIDKESLIKSVKTTFFNKNMDILRLAFKYQMSGQYSFSEWFLKKLKYFGIEVSLKSKTSEEARYELGRLVDKHNLKNFIIFIHYLIWQIGVNAAGKKRLKNTVYQGVAKNKQLSFWRRFFIEANMIPSDWYFGDYLKWGKQYKKTGKFWDKLF